MSRTAVIASNSNGEPLLIRLSVRESETAPSRIKVGFAVNTEEGLGATDGQRVQKIPSPDDLPSEVMIEREFRIEMN